MNWTLVVYQNFIENVPAGYHCWVLKEGEKFIIPFIILFRSTDISSFALYVDKEGTCISEEEFNHYLNNPDEVYMQALL